MKKIKPILFLLMLSSTLLMIQSCNDNCDDIECLNGGSCIDGSCDCPDGYSGTNCKTVDLCFGVTCQNGGDCVDGTCKCPDGFYGTSCENMTVQHRLLTKTPFQLFNDNVPLDSLYGKLYEGGLIFYLNTTNGTGMVSAIQDQSNDVAWGCYGTDIANLNNVIFCSDDCVTPEPAETEEGARIGDGFTNTDKILVGCTTNGIPAKLCRDQGVEWFLPSRGELNMMYKNLRQKGFGNFEADFYWSSSEASNNVTWVQNINIGSQFMHFKTNNNRVRAARAF